MTRNEIVTVEEMWESVARSFPVPLAEEQRVGIVLLRELAGGKPVAVARLAEALGASLPATETLVRNWALAPLVHFGDAGEIRGFHGLAAVPMSHRFAIGGRTLWTWCAYDTLFLPELLGQTAAVESSDPETGQLIRLTVSPDRVETAEPADVAVSMVRPGAWDLTSALRIMTSACHHIFFFASRAAGERWRVKHADVVLLSLDEAFAFAKRFNAHVFGAELARRRARAA
ncbi:MAG: organomercurial lyase [Xanthobacteraceae bacterium]